MQVTLKQRLFKSLPSQPRDVSPGNMLNHAAVTGDYGVSCITRVVIQSSLKQMTTLRQPSSVPELSFLLAPIWGGKKGEFRDWTRGNLNRAL